MNLGASSFLGIALSDRAIACAQVTVSGGSRTVQRLGSLALPADAPLDNPSAAGKALAAFLRQRRFSGSRAVVGVPARWTIAVEKELPPADAHQARGILSLHSERLSLADSGELVFDYAGAYDRQAASRVLLVGMPRNRLEQVRQLMQSAGLSMVGVTSSALALAWAGRSDGQSLPMVLLCEQGVEMVWEERGHPRMLRYLSVPASNGHGPSMSTLGAELRRAVTLGPSSGAGVLLWDSVGLSEEQVAELSGRIGTTVRPGRMAAMLKAAAAPAADADRHAAAIALGLAGAQRQLPLDFSRSKLAPPRQRRFGRRTIWGVVLGLTVIGAVAALYADTQNRRVLLAELRQQLKGLEPQVKQAQQNLERIDYGRGFFETRPQMLECLREITLTFRADERIWATSFTMRDSGKGQLIGKASDQRTVLALLDRLKKNSRFASATLLDMREASDRSREVAYSIALEFKAPE